MKIGLFIVLTFVSFLSHAQEELELDSTMIQLSGVVIGEDDLEPLPYTTIFDKTQRRGVIADYYGFFYSSEFYDATLSASAF